MNHHEVIVIGGGRAGLAIGYLLARQGRGVTILEAADGPAATWRARWDSLTLFTPIRQLGCQLWVDELSRAARGGPARARFALVHAARA